MRKNEQIDSMMNNNARWPVAVYTKTPYNYVINLFHSLPHLNMWFAMSDSKFNPKDADYLETILFWSTVPILTLIFILLILIIYACYLVVFANNTKTIKLNQNANRFFSTNLTKKNKTLFKFKFFISVFVFFLSVALGFIVYGSEQFHYSFREVHYHVKNFTNYFIQLGSQATQIKELINNQMSTVLRNYEQDIKELMRQDSYLHSTSSSALGEIGKIRHSLNESLNVLSLLSHFDENRSIYVSLMNQINMVEQTRWAIMIGVVTVNMLLISLLVLGLIRNSKGSLCFFAFAGVLSLISIWILNSLYLGITVFFADYCTSPDQYILTLVNRNGTKNSVQYFTSCSSGEIKTHNFTKQKLLQNLPFYTEFNKVIAKVHTANILYRDNFLVLYRKITNNNFIYNQNFTDTVLLIDGLMDRMRASIKCDQTSLSYREAVNALCTNSILGMAIVVLSGLIFGFVMPILICVIPQIWRRMHTKELYEYHNSNTSGQMLNEETHPFISSNTATAQIRTNISAARQFNESPSFQRLAANSSSTNSNMTNTLNRNRYNTASRSNYAAASSMGTNANPYSQTLKMTNRLHNDYMLNSDPYSMLNNQAQVNIGLASAPTQSNSNGNYGNFNLNNSNYGVPNQLMQNNHYNSNTLKTNAINVPILLYPNASYSSRTLSLANGRKYDINGNSGMYGTLKNM